MSLFRHALPGSCICLLFMALYMPAQAASVEGFSQKVFNFQLKLAQDGKVNSQYKLARLYETGQGTGQDMALAMRWFTEASSNGFEAAADRITFHEIRAEGYSSSRYGDWVDGVVDRARSGDHEAMRLLSQMYVEGLGVRRDDRKALKLLLELSMAGFSEVDADIARLETKLSANTDTPTDTTLVLREAPAGGRTAAGIITQQVRSSSAGGTIADRVAQELLEKRRRYEVVMRQLHEEQRMLEQQQRWAEGDVRD